MYDYNNRNVFRGSRYQHGSGIGNIFGSLIKRAIPWIFRGAKHLGKVAAPHAMRMGADVMSDVAEGENLRQSLKRHGKRAVAELDVIFLRKCKKAAVEEA